MTLVLVRKLLRDVRWPLVVVWVILFAFSLLWVKVAQRISTEISPLMNAIMTRGNVNPKVFEQVMFKGPGRVTQSMMGGADVRFDRPNDFLAVELLHPVVLILATLWAVGRSASAISGELDRGTMELLLSQPIPRSRIVVAHFLTDCLVIPLLALSIALGTRAGLAAVGPFTVDRSMLDQLLPGVTFPNAPTVLNVDASRQWLAILVVASLLFAMSGVTIFISSCNRSRWRTIALAAMVMLGMFAFNILGQLWDTAAVLRPCTLFYYYQPQKVWLKGEWFVNLNEAWPWNVSLPGIAVLLTVGSVGYIGSYIVFTRRDLPAPL
jgi:ABC-2 type transport system permease protein